MKKLMLLFGIVAFMSTSSVSFATVNSSDDAISMDCNDCKDHKCDAKCKKDGCTHAKCTAEEKAKCEASGKKACCKKGTESKKSCCKKGSSKQCSKKKEETKK